MEHGSAWKTSPVLRGQLTFIDFLHHLVGIKINCSHFMKALSCSGCVWLSLLGTEKSTGGPRSHHLLHKETRLHWGHHCHPRQCVTVPGALCFQWQIGVNPLGLRLRGLLGMADLKEHRWCVTELWVYAGPWSWAGLLAVGSREYRRGCNGNLEKRVLNCSDRLTLCLGCWDKF